MEASAKRGAVLILPAFETAEGVEMEKGKEVAEKAAAGVHGKGASVDGIDGGRCRRDGGKIGQLQESEAKLQAGKWQEKDNKLAKVVFVLKRSFSSTPGSHPLDSLIRGQAGPHGPHRCQRGDIVQPGLVRHGTRLHQVWM